MPLLAAVQVGRAVDRGHVTAVIRAGTLLTLAGVALVALSPNLVLLGVANVLLGCGQMTSMISAQGLIPRTTKSEDLDRRFGNWSVSVSLGQTIGLPLVGLIVSAGSTPEAGIMSALVLLVALCTVASVVSLAPALRYPAFAAEDGEREPPQAITAMLKVAGMRSAMFGSVVVLVSIDLLMAHLPVLGVQRGFGVLSVTLILTARSAPALVARVFMTPIRSRVSRETLLVAAALGSAPMMLCLALASNPWMIGVCVVVAGFVWGLGQPMSMTWVASPVTPANRASALSLRLTGNRVGQVIVPLGAGALTSTVGVSAVFVAIGLLLLASAGSTWRAASLPS